MTVVERIMRTMTTAILLALTLVYAVTHAQETPSPKQAMVSNGAQASLRGMTELDATRAADLFKQIPKDRKPYVSDYIYQPPLIPHQIRHYELSTNANKCLSCHSFKNSVASGATKISVTHYATREGRVLSDVSPRRYFCLQCHVSQVDADALVPNNFKAVDSLR